jgi:hypothetical protein
MENFSNFKLAFTDNTSYAGKDLTGFYAEALLKGVSKESFRLIPDVKSKAKIAKLNLGSILQDADCSFSGSGEGTLDQKAVEAHDIKINLEYCLRTWERNYLSELLRPGSNTNELMPATVEEFLLNQISLQVAAELERVVWTGTASSPLFTQEAGLINKLLADGDVIDVAGATLSAANIVAELGKAYNAIPAEIRGTEDLVMYIGTAAAAFYRQALANASAETFYLQNHTELSYLDVKIIVAPGLPANTAVVAQRNNLLLLTDLMSDFNEALILPQRNVTGSPVVRFVADMKFGVDFVYGKEIVLYRK